MPLIHGKSKSAFGHNVSAEVHAGKPIKQAVAIAYSEKRKHMAEGGEVETDDVLIDQCVEELFEAIEKKDKQMFLDAFQALVLHIHELDEEQDEEMGE